MYYIRIVCINIHSIYIIWRKLTKSSIIKFHFITLYLFLMLFNEKFEYPIESFACVQTEVDGVSIPYYK